MSKGSKRRPGKGYAENWEKIFNKEKKMITIYGKPRCTYCDAAKRLCEQQGLDFEYKMLDADYTADELFEKVPNARTFPQIFVDDKSIGGYTDLVEHLNG